MPLQLFPASADCVARAERHPAGVHLGDSTDSGDIEEEMGEKVMMMMMMMMMMILVAISKKKWVRQ